MQEYLSEVTARWLLWELVRTTLLLAALGAAAWLMLRVARVSSPWLHRACCVLVLLAGWTFVRWPIDVAWYEAPTVPVTVEEDNVKSSSLASTPPIDPALLSPPLEFGPAMSSATPATPGSIPAEVATELAAAPAVDPRSDSPIHWQPIAVAVWLGGIVATIAWWAIGYVHFLWRLPRALESTSQWQAEFDAACAEQGRAAHVEFRVTDELGPLLCRLPRKTVLLVPSSLWCELDADERRAILQHEIEHLRRGDLWKSLAVRLLALPHWFNPIAWLAVRRFDDAAEWACDRAAMGQQPTAYAAMLLRLGELAGSRARFGSAMSNRPLTTRIRRLLTLNGTEDSTMKKAALISLLLVVVPLAAIRVNLVAEEPEAKATLADDTQQHAELIQAAQAVENAATQAATDSVEQPPAGEATEDRPVDTPVKAAQRRMVEFAKKTYEAQDAAYKSGTITLDQLFHWSGVWLSAELGVAESREEQLAAAQRNLARLKVVEANIRRLHEQGARGGEHNAMSAANYYVADAERRVAEIEAMLEQVKSVQPARSRELVDAARQGFEATTAAYNASTASLETVISWSLRWLATELDVVGSREEQLAAAEAHLARVKDLHAKVEALNRTGSNGGEATVMATANYYLTDAKQRLAELDRQPEHTSAASDQRSTAAQNTERREQLASPRDAQIAPPANRRSRPLTPYPEPAAGVGLEEPNVVHRFGGKYYQLDDPALPSVLKAALRARTREEMLQAMSDVCIRLPRAGGSSVEIRFPQLAPELIALLAHQDPKMRDRAENALLSIRSSIEADLQEAAKSNNAEIAARAKRLLERSEPEPPRRPSGYFKLLSGQPQAQSPTAGQAFPSSAAASQPSPSYQYVPSEPPRAGQPTLFVPAPPGTAAPQFQSGKPTTAPKYAAHPYANKSLDSIPQWVLGSQTFTADDPALPDAIQSALRQGTTELKLGAMNLIRVRFEKNGITYERIHTGFTPELIALLGDKDPQVRDRAEAVLWSIGSAKSDLQQAAKSDNPEIAKRARRLLEGTGPIVAAAQAANRSVPLPVHAPAKGEKIPASGSTTSPVGQPANPTAKYTPVDPYSSDRLLYDGKTFEQWMEKLEFELSPVKRREAILAMGAFAAHGYERRAIDVIFRVMRDHSIWKIDSEPEDLLEQTAMDEAIKISAAQRLPAIINALKSGNNNQRLFAIRVIPLDAAKDEIIPLLVAALDDMDSAVVSMARLQLAIVDHDNPQLIASLASGLASSDTQDVGNAVQVVRGGDSRPYPTLLPKALALFDHDSPDIRDVAIRTLTALSTGPEQPAYVEALEEIENGGGPQALNAVKVLDGEIGEGRLLQRQPQLIDRRK